MNDPSSLDRRRFLQCSLAIAAGLRITDVSAAEAVKPAALAATRIIDTNVYLDRWPLRRVHLDNTAKLVEKLRQQHVEEAWAGSLDGLLHKDIAGVNARLAEECHEHGGGMLKPFGTINLTLPEWEEDARCCAEVHHMLGIRLHPNYHGYSLEDPRFAEVLKLATSRRLAVQLVLSMEDERTQHPLMRVPNVDITPLSRALEATPGARVMLLNWPRVAGKPVLLTLQNTSVVFDIAMLEGLAGIETTLEELPLERLCFGSYAPVFYHESATLKLQESALNEAQLTAITHANARRFLAA
jgi:predicted TIM-barrel fold metal-dependent hydrolase